MIYTHPSAPSTAYYCSETYPDRDRFHSFPSYNSDSKPSLSKKRKQRIYTHMNTVHSRRLLRHENGRGNTDYDERGRLLSFKENFGQRRVRLEFVHQQEVLYDTSLSNNKETFGVITALQTSSSSILNQVKAATTIQRAYRVYRAVIALRLIAKTFLSPSSDSHKSLSTRHSFLRARSTELGVLGSWLDATPLISLNPRVQTATRAACLAHKKSWAEFERLRKEAEIARTYGHRDHGFGKNNLYVHKLQDAHTVRTLNATTDWWSLDTYNSDGDSDFGDFGDDDFGSSIEIRSAEDSSPSCSSPSNSPVSSSSSDITEEDLHLEHTEHHDFAASQTYAETEEEEAVIRAAMYMRDRWLRQQRARASVYKKYTHVSKPPSLASIREQEE